jgi:hypothetical protein
VHSKIPFAGLLVKRLNAALNLQHRTLEDLEHWAQETPFVVTPEHKALCD